MTYQHLVSPKYWFVLTFWVGILNAGIALGAWQVGIAPGLYSALLVSFIIGYSILFANLIAIEILQRWLSRILICIVASILGLIAGLLIAGYLISGNSLFFIASDNPTLLLSILVTSMASTIALFYLYIRTAKSELQQARIKQLEQEKQISVSQLRLLQAQIEPHFLFNTLANTISLIDNEPKTARQMLEKLTQYLRVSFTQLRQTYYRLHEEIELITLYLEIQTMRMGDRFTYSIDNQCSNSDYPIPPLLIQPIVENAVTHGLEPLTTQGRLEIRIHTTASTVYIEVADNGVGLGNSQQGTGHASALNNIRQRLHSYYGDGARLTITEQQTGGTKVNITLPGTPGTYR